MPQPQKSDVQVLHAQICQAMADPIRITVLYELAAGPKHVGELAEALHYTQPTVSRHLKVLRERGLVHTERLGTMVVYSLADRRVIKALNLLREVLTDGLMQKTALVDLMATV